ncbi:MAG: hypothetical protein RRY12_10795 [Cloacibacillus sp.]
MIKSKEELVQLWQNQDKEGLARLSETEDGRAFLCRLLVECGTFEAIHETEPAEAAWLEGRRSIGLWVLNELEAADNERRGAKLLECFGAAGRFLGMILRRQADKKTSMEVLVNGGDK